MSRYVDVDYILTEAEHAFSDWSDYEWLNLITYHQNAPSIDIVRCEECMHNGSYDTDCPFGWRNGEWNMPKPCDFCSYGERNK